MAEAPVPMTATRLPVRSSHGSTGGVEDVALELSRPSMFGDAGSVSGPTAETTKFAEKAP